MAEGAGSPSTSRRPRSGRRGRRSTCRSRSRSSPPPDRSRATSWIATRSHGELALDGRVRPVAGVFAVAEGARRARLPRIICAAGSAPEAALAGVEPVRRGHLAEAVAYLRGEHEPGARSRAQRLEASAARSTWPTSAARSARGARSSSRPRVRTTCSSPGRPGTGKTMLARRLPGLLPALDDEAALEVTRIHSVAGLLPPEHPLVTTPPVSRAAPQRLGGRDRRRRPRAASGRGEPRAPRRAACSTSCRSSSGPALEALRQPLEDGAISVARAEGTALYPGALSAARDDEPLPVRCARRSGRRLLVHAAAA